MAADVVVSPIPDGSARVADVHMLPFLESGVVTDNMAMSRGGNKAFNYANSGWFSNATNWGLNGDTPDSVIYLGAHFYRIRAGARALNHRIPLITTSPAFRSWDVGRFTVGLVFSWPTNTLNGNVETGLFLSYTLFARPLSAGNQGFGLYNDGGTLKVVCVGPAATEKTDVSAGVNPQAINKARFEFHQPTSQGPGSVQLYVNDDSSPRYTKLTNDANMPTPNAANIALAIYLGTLSNAEYFYFRDLKFTAGPDVAASLGV